MTDLSNNNEQKQAFSFLRKSVSNNKTDLFSQFENSRNVLKNNKQKTNDKLTFNSKSKSKQKQNEDYDEYDQDFQQFNKSTTKKKEKLPINKTQLQKKGQKKRDDSKNKQIKKPEQNRIIQKRNHSKSSLSRKFGEASNADNIELGRYQSQVEKKFGAIQSQSMGTQAINRFNQQIRDEIKRYNDILTDLINKNLTLLTKKKNTVPVQQTIKVLKQQIKNNNKLQQLDLIELKRLQNYKNKLEQQQNYSDKTLQQQIAELQNQIKQKKKVIYNKKLEVQNESKKLVPSNIISSKNQVFPEASNLKQKLQAIRKEHQKNQQKINSLQTRQTQLKTKIQQLGNDVDKQAYSIRSNQKVSQDKKKRFHQIKKKHEDLKSFISKTQALWTTKCNVSIHQNQSLKQKLKNLDLQIKNIEQSIKMSYQKSLKTLQTTKPKNQQSVKMLQKIKIQMSQHSENNTIKNQMSLSQMKILTKKKQSVQGYSIHQQPNQNATQNKNNKMEKQSKTKSQQSQRSRVWKQQNLNTKQTKKLIIQAKKQTQTKKIFEGETQANKMKQQTQKQKQKVNKAEKQEQHTGVQMQSKNNQQGNRAGPKKFNFNRNKANSQIKLEAEKIQQDTNNKKSTQLQKIMEKNTQNNEKTNKSINAYGQQNSKEKYPLFTEKQNRIGEPQRQKKVQEQKNQDGQTTIKPKRFLNMRDRKSKQQNEGYMPSVQTKTKQQKNTTKAGINQDLATNNPANNQPGNQVNKPMFNLKRKKQSQRKLDLDNQFIGQ